MANLLETVNTHNQLALSQKVVKVGLSKKDLHLSAEAEKASKSATFYLVRVPVRKLPLFSVDAVSDSCLIVVDVNATRKKATHSGFTPKVILLRGLSTLQAQKASDKMFCNAWVGDKALKKMHISAEDAVGSNELQTKLQRCISEKYKNKNKSEASDASSYSPSPWVREVYPFDNYFIFEYDGNTFKQTYSLSSETREPSLTGEPSEVFIKYVPEAVSASSLADILYFNTFIDKTMGQEMTLDKINVSSPALGSMAYNPPVVPDGTYYPVGSELARPELRTMLNVREALDIFLSVLKDGMKGPLTHSFSPVAVPTDRFFINACSEARIAAKLARKNIDTREFVIWQHNTLTQKEPQTKFGLEASAFAYVGDRGDISTWLLRADSEDAVGKSLRHVMDCEGIPDRKRTAIKLKLEAMKKNFKAGGPGSGRKPTWSRGSSNHDDLNLFHRQAVGEGYKYQGSRFVWDHTRVHEYHRKSDNSDYTIVEKDNGNHRTISR